MGQVIICQFAMFQHRVDMRQTGLWTIAHGNGYGTIELYDWRRLNSYQLVQSATICRQSIAATDSASASRHSKQQNSTRTKAALWCQAVARKSHLPFVWIGLVSFLSSTWGRADQHTSRDSNRVWGVLFCAKSGGFTSLRQQARAGKHRLGSFDDSAAARFNLESAPPLLSRDWQRPAKECA